MNLRDLQIYIESEKNLTKIVPTIELNADGYNDEFYVLSTKATYAFSSEDAADDKIDWARQLSGFQKCDKKFKPGKVNKSGEILRDDMWIVTIQLAH